MPLWRAGPCPQASDAFEEISVSSTSQLPPPTVPTPPEPPRSASLDLAAELAAALAADPPRAELLEVARHGAEAHARFQRMMTEAHLEYLRVIKAILAGRSPAAPTGKAGPPATAPGSVPAQPDRHSPLPPVPAATDPARSGPEAGSTPAADGLVADGPPSDGQGAGTPTADTPGADGAETTVGAAARPAEPDTGRDRIAPAAGDRPAHHAPTLLHSLLPRTESPIAPDDDPDTDLTDPAEARVPGRLRPTPLPESAPDEDAVAVELIDTFDPDQLELPLAPIAPLAEADDETGVPRLTPFWAETALGGLALPGLDAGTINVVDGGSGLAEAVVAELDKRGLEATVAERPGPGGVLFLGGMATPVSPQEAIDMQLAALTLAREGRDRGIFVTVADTSAGPAAAWLGGFGGLVATVAHERRATSVVAVECERGDRSPGVLATLLADELTRGAGAQRVRLAADGTRTVGHLGPAADGTRRERRITSESVIVVSGGARGVSGAAAVQLARAAAPRLVLLGRTPLIAEPEGLADAVDEKSLLRKLAAGTGGPDGLAGMRTRARAMLASREVRATLDACIAAGAGVRYICADVRDTAAVAAGLEQVRAAWGPITGLVHGAGVSTERVLREKTSDEVATVVGTKLTGLLSLLQATAHDPLETLVLFSSVVGWHGGYGQGDLALASAALDRIAAAEQQRRPGCLVRSLAWGPTSSAAAFVAELGVDGPAHVVLDLAPGRPERGQLTTVAISDETHPWLTDHRPKGIPILPLAAGLGWMAAAAGVRGKYAALTGVRVLRPVVTERPQIIKIAVTGREVSLSNGAGDACFRAGFGPAGPDHQWRPTGDPARFPGSTLYEGRPLFQGPRLHVVRSLGELGPEGVVGTVLGARAMGWAEDDLPVDLAALDGALQLAGVWAMDEHRPALPLALAECRIHRWGRLPGTALGIVSGGRRDETVRCDVALVGPDGEVWVELLGVEFVALP
jgi:NAD(P)-dependent dehydrogenase (short-subunit alcohol dehydrogenase family)